MRAALAIPGDWRLESKIDRMTGARRERHEPNRPRESSCGGWRHDRPAWLSVIAMLTVGADSEECRLMNHSRHKRPSPCRRGREPSMNSPACNRPAWNSPACNCPSGPLEGRRREPDWRAPPLDRDRLPGETKLQAVENIHQHGLNGAKCRDRARFRPKRSSASSKTAEISYWKGCWRGQNAFFSVL
jgi:hypothetical protein